jgi:HEPN domain-containing protein
MPNKTSAKEWLIKAYHDLSSARVLYAANHYTDTIGNDLQQAIEKTLKSFLAYENKQIRKTHDLIEVSRLVDAYIQFSASEKEILDVATAYYAQDRYPVPNLALPARDQIKKVLDFAEQLLGQVCRKLDIDKQDVTK